MNSTPQSIQGAAVSPEKHWKEIRKQLPNYLFILPHFLLFAVFILFPIFRSIHISMFDWKIMLKEQQFIGLANYETLLNDQIFWQELGNTNYIMVFTVV
jgi:ABC-type sugar transport system permease subunit